MSARRAGWTVWWLAVLALAGCVRVTTTVPPAPAGVPPTAWEQIGIASFYGAQHDGRRTASGEIYDMRQLTAAHRTLPFGSRLLVEDLATGRSVEVRVNDRGPFVDGRILDLSYAAAQALGGVERGLMRVRVRLVRPDR